jgi:ATP-binding protein involved in chromosome partitioning
MSYFECPHCKGRTEIFSHAGARIEAEKLGVPFLGEIPLAIEVRKTSDEGEPIVLSDPKAAISLQYRAAADHLWAALEA